MSLRMPLPARDAVPSEASADVAAQLEVMRARARNAELLAKLESDGSPAQRALGILRGQETGVR